MDTCSCSCSMEMPKYKCHKEVWALKIAEIELDKDLNSKLKEQAPRETDGSAVITPEDKRYARFRVSAEYLKKHNPQVGGYYVVYKDGYKSFSPAEAFESGYAKITKAEKIEKMRDLVKTQCQPGNWNCNPYMFGMANGMILMMAMIDGVEPKYLDKPDTFLDDMPEQECSPAVHQDQS